MRQNQVTHPVYVVIATAGRAPLLGSTLESLARCELPPEYAGCLVVENGPAGGAEEQVAKWEVAVAARYYHVPEPNKSKALNVVIGELDEDALVIFTDDDVKFQIQTVNEYSKAGRRYKRGNYFGGPLVADYDTPPPEWLRNYFPPSASGWEPREEDADSKELFFSGPNWAAFVGDLHGVGPFDPNLGPTPDCLTGGEETDMQCRLQLAGIRSQYVPRAVIHHYVPVERCSPKWMLARSFRAAIWSGMKSNDSSPRLFGCPRWTYARFPLVWAKAILGKLSRSNQRRFELNRDLQLLRGFMRGTRLASRRANRSHNEVVDRSSSPA